jgi:large subunit ribosomal protein L13
MKTFSAKPAEVKHDWYLVDANGLTLGRLATELATRLRGKHKAEYTPHVDTGDYIVVINAEKIHVTGNKLTQKMYHHHTGYIGNLKSERLDKRLERAPETVITAAVKGMLPKNTLGRQMLKKLRVFAGTEHPHAAQQPQTLTLN